MLCFLFTTLSSLSTGGGWFGNVVLGPAVKYPADVGGPAKFYIILLEYSHEKYKQL